MARLELIVSLGQWNKFVSISGRKSTAAPVTAPTTTALQRASGTFDASSSMAKCAAGNKKTNLRTVDRSRRRRDAGPGALGHLSQATSGQ